MASKWINELRKGINQNSDNNLLPSKRSSSLGSIVCSPYTDNSASESSSKPRSGSLNSSSDSFPTLERNSFTPSISRQCVPYISPPCSETKLKAMNSDFNLQESSVKVEKEIERENSVVSDTSLPSLLSRCDSDQLRESQSLNRRRMSIKTDLPPFEEEDSDFCIEEEDSTESSPHEVDVSIEDKSQIYIDYMKGMNQERITREQYRSLYGSMQSKVQEYLELKVRIDQITKNISKE